MAAITASMVAELRARTDAPMMECKKALTEAQGNMEKAEEILRIKLGNKANKAASRVAAEGIVGMHISADGKLAAMCELNCETDFVAKNDDFQALAKKLAALVASSAPADITALSALPLDGTSVEDVRKALVGKIGENLSIRRFVRIEAKGRVSGYVHGGKIGAMVDLVGGDETLGRELAMHVAAAKPVAVSREHVPVELIEKERTIAAAKAAESGKPANIVEKMVEGSVQKFLKEVTLLGQPFIKDDKTTIEALLRTKSASVTTFTLYVVGEGIEKKKDDFAAEVAATMAAAKGQ